MKNVVKFIKKYKHFKVGDTVKTSEKIEKRLVHLGYAEFVEEGKKEKVKEVKEAPKDKMIEKKDTKNKKK